MHMCLWMQWTDLFLSHSKGKTADVPNQEGLKNRAPTQHTNRTVTPSQIYFCNMQLKTGDLGAHGAPPLFMPPGLLPGLLLITRRRLLLPLHLLLLPPRQLVELAVGADEIPPRMPDGKN